MKIWITKYALTSGVTIVEDAKIDGTMASWKGSYVNFAHNNEWHSTREGAIAHVERMRENKIRNLEKGLAKLRIMKIEVPS